MFRFGIGQFLPKRLGARRIVEAGTFDQALDRLRHCKIDLAIFDLRMPELKNAGDLKLVRDLKPDLSTPEQTQGGSLLSPPPSFARSHHPCLRWFQFEDVSLPFTVRLLHNRAIFATGAWLIRTSLVD